MGFDPVEKLKILLGPSPEEPWPALLPQILLWCFRRFCIQKLTESEGTLSESLWPDLFHLLQMYCPRGLESTSLDWMTPANMDAMHSSGEEYNKFFLEFVRYFDEVIMNDDYASQDDLSEFLDTKISAIIYAWLNNSPFSIFPMNVTEEDSFTDDKFKELIDALMLHVNKIQEPVESEDEQEQEEAQEEAQEAQEAQEAHQEAQEEAQQEAQEDQPQSLLWKYLCLPPMLPESFAPHPYVYRESLAPQCLPQSPPLSLPINTVARAMAYRRTIRKHRGSRVKTRRSHPPL